MRLVGARTLAGLFTLTWLILPGFGLIDLSVTWSREWPQVLEAGWGLFFTVLVAGAFVLVVIQPPESRAGVVQLGAATACLAVSALAATEARLATLAVPLAVEAAIVGLLVRPAWLRPRGGKSLPALVLAAAGIVPWIVYALHMWSLDRQGRAGGDNTVGIDHYSVQGALALALALLPVAAGLWRDLRPFVPICAGVAAAYLGLVSLCHQGAEGGFERVWSALAIGWGAALGAVAIGELRRRRVSPAAGTRRR